ncbi:MAG TPA: hypothetical protein VK927_10895, partial [Adhaeribacter sp.]|nr:hypothetical protein [Adhaeribacter sp.]
GARFKYKVGEVYSLGFDAYINPQTFYLKQEEGKNLPNPLLHDMEKFKFTNVGLGFFNRFNYDKRGNYMGNFIDLGVYGNWMPVRNFIYQTDDLPPAVGYVTGANAIKVRQTGLKYITKLNYGATVRAGFNRYVFYATYRLSDLFDADYAVSDGAGNIYTFAEMPRATIGFQLSMHK